MSVHVKKKSNNNLSEGGKIQLTEQNKRYVFREQRYQIYDKLKQEYLDINQCKKYMNDYEGILDRLSFTVQENVNIHKQLPEIMTNLSLAEGIVEDWLETTNDQEYEELYTLIKDSCNRIEKITQHNKTK